MLRDTLRRGDQGENRVALPEMLLGPDLLPHLICSPRLRHRGVSFESVGRTQGRRLAEQLDGIDRGPDTEQIR